MEGWKFIFMNLNLNPLNGKTNPMVILTGVQGLLPYTILVISA